MTGNRPLSAASPASAGSLPPECRALLRRCSRPPSDDIARDKGDSPQAAHCRLSSRDCPRAHHDPRAGCRPSRPMFRQQGRHRMSAGTSPEPDCAASIRFANPLLGDGPCRPRTMTRNKDASRRFCGPRSADRPHLRMPRWPAGHARDGLPRADTGHGAGHGSRSRRGAFAGQAASGSVSPADAREPCGPANP